MKQITGRQQEVLDFISSFTKENNYPPTVREIGEHFNISLRAVQDHIAALQKKASLHKLKNVRAHSVLSMEQASRLRLLSAKFLFWVLLPQASLF